MDWSYSNKIIFYKTAALFSGLCGGPWFRQLGHFKLSVITSLFLLMMSCRKESVFYAGYKHPQWVRNQENIKRERSSSSRLENGWVSMREGGRQLGSRYLARQAVRLELGYLPQAGVYVGKFSLCQAEYWEAGCYCGPFQSFYYIPFSTHDNLT